MYGNRKQSAEDMLQSALEGGLIKKHQFEEMSEFIFKVEGTYTLACESNKEEDFDRESVYKQIFKEAASSQRKMVVVCLQTTR